MIEKGTIIADRYEVIGPVGSGGMSDVYKAKDSKLGRNVAIKVLKKEFSEDGTFVTKFRTEAQAAAALEHPNIVNIYDVGCENGDYYIVMEYVEGITLKTYIEKKGKLSFKETLSIAIQVARGIQAAHAKGIIHRDIKPQNIIISTEGKVKVTDFGIARAASTNTNTIHSDVMGSVHYISPEQARNGYVSERSDIYSLGIVMYEMVTGRVPFDGDSTVAVAIQHLQDEMVAPSAYAEDLPISLEKIILKCTQKSPDRRYQSMDDLLIDLRKSLLSPDEDFVTLAGPLQDKTRVLSKDEVDEIQNSQNNDDEEELLPEENDGDEEEEDEDEEKGGFLNPKMEKAVTIMGIVAAIVIAIIVIYLIGSFLGVFHFGGKSNQNAPASAVSEENTETVEMIDIRGMQFDDAESKLSDMGLVLKVGDTVESEDHEPGEIIEQETEPGEQVPAGSTVYVTVCAQEDAKEVEVPDVTGDSSDKAMSALRDAGFNPSREYRYSSDVAAGNVIEQSPKGGTVLTEGETVTIYVSQGTETVKVPSLLGKTESAAKSALKDAGLSVGTVTQDYSDDYPEGQVMSQSTSSGKYLEKGDTVDLVISQGPEQTVATYRYSASVTAPSGYDVTSADIELLDSTGDTIQAWNGVTSFPYQVKVNDIEEESHGTLQITWYYTTEDGRNQTYVQEENVSFTKNN